MRVRKIIEVIISRNECQDPSLLTFIDFDQLKFTDGVTSKEFAQTPLGKTIYETYKGDNKKLIIFKILPMDIPYTVGPSH